MNIYLRHPHLRHAACLIIIFTFCGCRSLFSSKHNATIPPDIVKQIVNHPDLQGFLHPEIHGRIPLVISDHLVQPDISMSKFGRAVSILPESELSTSAFLRFTDFKVNGDTATVELEYKIEGVGAKYVFTRNADGSWRFKDANVWEY